MRLFRRDKLHVIFLAPVAMYALSENGGCASTPESRPGPLTAQEIAATIPGNTFKMADQESYAFVDPDGELRGLNVPNGATTGRWSVSDNGVLCASWATPKGEVSNCDALAFFSQEIGYQWGGNTVVLLEGNPKNL